MHLKHQKPFEYSEDAGEGGSDFLVGVNPGDPDSSASSLTTCSSSESSSGSGLVGFFRFGAFAVDLARFLSAMTDLGRDFEVLHFLELHIFVDSLE